MPGSGSRIAGAEPFDPVSAMATPGPVIPPLGLFNG